MNRLNKARVNLKHYGNTPSKLDIDDFRTITQEFYNESCSAIFDIDFDNISLIDLVKYKRPKDYLKKAKDAFENNLIDESLDNLAISFEYLILDYMKSKKPLFLGNLMTKIENINICPDDNKNRELYYFSNEITKAITTMQKPVQILSFGIDYKKYVKYRSMVPSVWFAADGTPKTFKMNRSIKMNKDDIDFCINFIVESSLKLQEFDFELNR